jgi:two-component system OmpR family response regulator
VNAVSTDSQCPTCGQPLPPGHPRPKVLQVADLVLNSETHDVARAGKKIDLSLREFRLLESLMQNSGSIVSKDLLVRLVWNSASVTQNLVDVSLYHLRRKVDNKKAKLIKTVRHVGYIIRDPA